MRPTIVVLPFLFLALPLPAQGHATSPIQPVGAKVCLTLSSELRATADGQGLCGGGASYRVRFADGMRFEPSLGSAVQEAQHLWLSPVSVRRGAFKVAELPSFAAPVQVDRMARYEHAPGVTECYEVRPEGVELSWVFDQPLAGDGDLVVRYAVDTLLPAPTAADDGLQFMLPAVGGVRIGGVTGIDARGARVTGGVRFVGGVLELSLPGAFVATAVYPLVLDPTIGGIVTVATGPVFVQHFDPDAAHDATTTWSLIVWQRMGANQEARGQRVTINGSLVGPFITFNTSGIASHPRVANLGTRDRFGVVWTQQDGSTSSVRFAAVDAATGAITHTLTVASSTTATYIDADIGCESAAAIGSSRGFVIVYDDNVLGAIRARRLWFNASDTLVTASAFSIFTDGGLLGPIYTKPVIARTASSDGSLLVVAHRNSPLFGTSSIVGTVVYSHTSTLGPSVTIYSNSNYDLSVPEVDGFAGRWVVAWQRNPAGSTDSRVLAASVSLDAAGASLSVSANTVFGDSSTRAMSPAVGYTPGKSWLGFSSLGMPVQYFGQRVIGIDGGSCVPCNDSFATPAFLVTPNLLNRIVIATMTSGAATSGEDALAVWSEGGGGIFVQRLRNHSTAGGISNVGGGCGTGGTQSYSHNPAIGSSGLVCTLNGLPVGALATIFNFSSYGPTIPCGACDWRPFSVTLTPPIVAGSASAEFAIPCLISLVGAVVETQWTTISIGQSPCLAFPGITLSDRLVLQIGQ